MVAEKLQRVIYREFLLEPTLLSEVGLEELPAQLASLLGCPEEEAVVRLTATPLLDALSLDQLKTLMSIRDMGLVSRTAAALSAELRQTGTSYDECCRMALCYAVIGSQAHVFSALRAAASKNDGYARHHFLYGLVLGADGDLQRARWELGLALAAEPYDQARATISRVLQLVDADQGH